MALVTVTLPEYSSLTKIFPKTDGAAASITQSLELRLEKTRSSPAAGATPSFQLAAVLMLLSSPAPVHSLTSPEP